jgi:translation initiation factor IF-1
MPLSISSVRVVPSDNSGLVATIGRCNSLGELLELVPAPFRPRMQNLVNQVYKAAVKSNHARSYLSTLERHAQDGTFPPEIGGRIHNPMVQTSKEYMASGEYKAQEAARDNSTRQHKKAMLDSVLESKRAEVTFLQTLFSENSYKDEADTIGHEVTISLASDASVEIMQDGKPNVSGLPAWIKQDVDTYQKIRLIVPQRAIALAYAAVQQEMSKKFKSLSLKKRTDEDIEMQDSNAKSETVDALVTRKVEQLLKEFKNQTPGMPLSPAMQRIEDITDTPRQRNGSKDQKSQTQESFRAADSEGHESRHGKRKRERREEASRQASKLERALSGSASRFEKPSGLVREALSLPLTELRKTDRVVVSTHGACQFLEANSELFCGVSSSARTQFVSHHTPVALFEVGHRFAEGIFKGPGVVIPRYIEYKLALNCKFILHHSPNSLRVHQAWPHLERSVRLRWHFRNSENREQSKFYEPKTSWMPPADQWNDAIEKGLRAGKDLLFERTAALNPADTHMSNPDVRSIKDFLQSSGLLLKITDKNLGLAAISKPWYLEECQRMLADEATYDYITKEDLEYYQHEALVRIREIVQSAAFSENVSEFLLASTEDHGIPEFHAIPKVHKTVWKLRPIVPSYSWVTRRASEVCDFVLRAFHRREMPWIVDSTREVLAHIAGKTITRSDRIWIVTGDVESFYTNVNTAETTELIHTALSGLDSSHGIDHNYVLHLLQVVMLCNCFGFNDEFYHQINGVAMGTSCAPAFANVALGFKEQFVESIAKAADNVEDGLILYNRYIDDILIIFKGSRTALQSCLDNISSKLQPFKISWEVSSSREPRSFLDVEFFFDQGFGPVGIQSRVYRKRMNQHQYIPWSSAHPQTVKKAFVKAELTRFMIISSTRQLFEERVVEYMQALGRRGYPSTILRVWKKQVSYEDRWYSLFKKKDTSVNGLPLMLPSSYDEIWEYTDLRSVFNAMMNEWVKCEEPLPPSLVGPLIKSLKRTENLFDKISSWNKAILKGSQSTLVDRSL